MRIPTLFLLCLGTIALAACGGTTTGWTYDANDDTWIPPPPTPSPEPVTFCAYPSGVKPQLIYPIPGSTGVSDSFNVRGIVVADRSAANYDTSTSYYMAWLGPESTDSAFESEVTPVILSTFYQIPAAQVPQPAAAPIFSAPVYEASSTPNAGLIYPIEPHEHYFVYLQRMWSDLSSNQCYAVGPIGDFTTQ